MVEFLVASSAEAAELAKLVETFIKALETHEFEERLRLLEARQNETRP
jgi:hypothetical protein